MKMSQPFSAFLQTLGVVVYVSLLTLLMVAMDGYASGPDNYSTMISVLLLLVFSAAVTGGLVFGYPALLVIKGKVKEGLWQLTWVGVWFLIFLIMLFSGMLIIG